VCSDIWSCLDMVPTHRDSWLSVCSWISIEGSSDRTEGRNGAYFIYHAEVLDFQAFFMAILVQVMIFRIFTPCNRSLLPCFRGRSCLHFITCIWPPIHVPLLVPRAAVLGTQITPSVLQKPYPVLPVPHLLIGQDFLKPFYTTDIPLPSTQHPPSAASQCVDGGGTLP
jgi:hypothetical protein